MQFLLIATICLQADPITVECRSEVWRIEQTPEACAAMLTPVQAFLTEQTAGLPVVRILAACKGGLVG
jgi:hypothetical protein